MPRSWTYTHGFIKEHTGRCRPGAPDGRQRPLAVAALEDKIVQRAAIGVLNAIYEEDFLGFSYGFRPKRGQHDALDALVVGLHHRKSELHSRRGHPVILRHGHPGLADPFPEAPDQRLAHNPPDPEVAQGGHPRRWDCDD